MFYWRIWDYRFGGSTCRSLSRTYLCWYKGGGTIDGKTQALDRRGTRTATGRCSRRQPGANASNNAGHEPDESWWVDWSGFQQVQKNERGTNRIGSSRRFELSMFRQRSALLLLLTGLLAGCASDAEQEQYLRYKSWQAFLGSSESQFTVRCVAPELAKCIRDYEARGFVRILRPTTRMMGR